MEKNITVVHKTFRLIEFLCDCCSELIKDCSYFLLISIVQVHNHHSAMNGSLCEEFAKELKTLFSYIQKYIEQVKLFFNFQDDIQKLQNSHKILFLDTLGCK